MGASGRPEVLFAPERSGQDISRLLRLLQDRVATRGARGDPMNRNECQKLIDSYVNWLRQGLSVEEVGGACELTTPFLDRHNDHLQVYAVRENGNIVLSDDGYILSDLRTSGLEMDTPKRKMVLDSVLNGLGVRVDNNQMKVEASP